ncbi:MULTISPECIES: nitrite reductase small subunit NirD [Nonomuraea]|jgi:nitrite reductase (NADH) small subunit|uniref:Nitrite reductase small subunit NirD n=1 Tax=Nonomuraea ferruginea TaxID=46174 RepID=A0ABT4T2B3_9ACTN|nr:MULTISPECIES: nitrite reductase small subunit NirD [Nonomuraea]MDA0643652.1 nitrite reductase small subunit NirD [Nonomuraea ferruginea]TXK39422.1 nitrite reductase small subunit NirD [Nonomuraea sp. C10]
MNWIGICGYDLLLPERGVCALVDGEQVALFRTYDGTVHALGNRDPFSGAYVLSRGIVGTRKGEATVASPLHKQVFSLVTGRCLDEPAVAVPVYRARVRDGAVQVSVSVPPSGARAQDRGLVSVGG